MRPSSPAIQSAWAAKTALLDCPGAADKVYQATLSGPSGTSGYLSASRLMATTGATTSRRGIAMATGAGGTGVGVGVGMGGRAGGGQGKADVPDATWGGGS